MDLGLKNKVIMVTGGASGFGEEIVRILSEEGALVAVIGRVETGPGETACKNAVESVIYRYGRIDGLVNNGDMHEGVSLEAGDHEQFMESLHRNLAYYYLMVHFALPYLKISKGAIVNISSKTGGTALGGVSADVAANGGRNALTREWAVELLKYNIRVNAVIVPEWQTPQYESKLQTMKNTTEKTRSLEIAHAVAFLLSEKSSHTTGQLIHVDGEYAHQNRAPANV
jgi:L-fucose dehydrogenase